MHEVKAIKETIAAAKAAEGEQQYETAIGFYDQALKQNPLNEDAYKRLMIIYRKQKDKKTNYI